MKPASHRTLALRWQWWRPSFQPQVIADGCEDVVEAILDDFEAYSGFLALWYIVLSAPMWVISPTSVTQWSLVRWVGFALYTLPVVIPAAAIAFLIIFAICHGVKWVVQHPPIKIVTRYEESE